VTGFGDTGSTTGSSNYTANTASPNNPNNANGYNGLLGSANTSTANDGITLKLLPAYDEASESVTVDIALSVEAVLSFNTLSAGSQIGSLSQPTTAEQTFNDTIRVRPGQTVVVGGLTYDQVSRSSAVPLFLPDSAKSSTLSVKRTALFIVVRPTVTVLGSLKDDSAQLFAAGEDGTAPQESQPESPTLPMAPPPVARAPVALKPAPAALATSAPTH
jgi:type II secretory pathway component GspD/PulD (secretin)